MPFKLNKLRIITLFLIALTIIITIFIPLSTERQIIDSSLLSIASLLAIIDCLLYRKEENSYTITLFSFTLLLISQLWLLYIAIF